MADDQASSSTPARTYRFSRRALFLLQEIRKLGADFGMPKESEWVDVEGAWWYADVEFPLTEELVAEMGDKGFAHPNRFKYIIFHVHVQTGPYKDGVFRLAVDLRNRSDYPNEPPKAKMLTKIWPPNINLAGVMDHSHFRLSNNIGNPGTWTPMLQINSFVHALVEMFDIESSAFCPWSPMNAKAAEQCPTCFSRSAVLRCCGWLVLQRSCWWLCHCFGSVFLLDCCRGLHSSLVQFVRKIRIQL